MTQEDDAMQVASKKQWAYMLSRYAGFLGHAVPAFRLEAAEFSSGTSGRGLSLSLANLRYWC